MPTDDELSCQQIVELVTDFLENALLPDMCQRLEEHLEQCPGCANYFEQVRLTIKMVHRLAQEPAFPAQKQQLLRLFQDWKKSSDSDHTER